MLETYLKTLSGKIIDPEAHTIPLDHPAGPLEDEPGTRPRQETLRPGEIQGPAVRQFVVDLQDLVDDGRVEQLRHVQLADVPEAGDIVAFGRLHGNDPHVGVPLLQESTAAGDGPAGSQREKQVGEPPLRLPPNLGAGGLIVGPDVLLVLVLVRHDVFVGLGPRVGLGQIDRAFAHARAGADVVVHHVQLGSRDSEEDLLLQRDAVGHDGAHAVAERGAHGGEADPGVARRRLDDAAPRGDGSRAARGRESSRTAARSLIEPKGFNHSSLA